MSIIVIGGANLDIKSVIAGKTVPATSNPGSSSLSPGRGRAQHCREPGAPGHATSALLSVVGDDDAGTRLIDGSVAAGIDMSLVTRAKGNTGTYAVVIDRRGEMVIGGRRYAPHRRPSRRVVIAHKARLAAACLLVAGLQLSAPRP